MCSYNRQTEVETTPAVAEIPFHENIKQGSTAAIDFLNKESGVRPSDPPSALERAILPRAYARLAEGVLLLKSASNYFVSRDELKTIVDDAVENVFRHVDANTAAEEQQVDPVAAIAAMLGIDPKELSVGVGGAVAQPA